MTRKEIIARANMLEQAARDSRNAERDYVIGANHTAPAPEVTRIMSRRVAGVVEYLEYARFAGDTCEAAAWTINISEAGRWTAADRQRVRDLYARLGGR